MLFEVRLKYSGLIKEVLGDTWRGNGGNRRRQGKDGSLLQFQVKCQPPASV